jgi:nitrous oxide reductase accessory protein NosL
MKKLLLLITATLFVTQLNAQTKPESNSAIINKKKLYPMGKRLFEKKCPQNIDLSKYTQIDELKLAIKTNKLCKPIKEKRLHALVLYLWEVKRVNPTDNGEIIIVTKDEKCPVCGMFTYKYPKWVAQLFYGKKHYSFDGVKDMMKFYLNPMEWGEFKDAKKENISKILVTDYYSQKAIDGKKAFYVIGSDILGPMGDELIPFKEMSDAKNFMDDHTGKKIIRFDEIFLKEL